MEEGETKRLVANLTFPDGTGVDISGFENLKWSWVIKGNQDTSFEIKPLYENANSADFTLIKGNFMDVIVTAKLDFTIPELNTRTVSRDFQIKGENQVPIMIVNEDDERIQDIPMINPEDLDGITSGDCNVSENKIFADLKLLTDYTSSLKDIFEFSFSDNETGKTYSGIAEETENESYIYKGTDNNGRILEFYMPVPKQSGIIIASRKENELENGEIKSITVDEENISDETTNVGFYDNGESKYFSNMVIETQQSLNQEKFINHNSIFRIKVLDKDLLDEENKIKLFIGDEENRNSINVILFPFGGYFISKVFCFSKDIKANYDSIMLKDKLVEIIYTTYSGDFTAIGKYNIYTYYYEKFITLGKGIRDAYMVKAWGPFGGFFEDGYSPALYRFIKSVYNVISLGYSPKIDKSPTRREFENNLENLSLLYTFTHGEKDVVIENGLSVLTGKLIVFEEKQNPYTYDNNKISYISFMNKKTDYKVVFFNGCMTGDKDFYEKFLQHIKTDVYIGWKDPVNPVDASNLAEKFFKWCNKINPETNDYYLVKIALKNAYTECFDVDDYPFDTKIFIEKNKDISLGVK